MPSLRVGLADAEPQREFAIELGVREKQVPLPFSRSIRSWLA